MVHLLLMESLVYLDQVEVFLILEVELQEELTVTVHIPDFLADNP